MRLLKWLFQPAYLLLIIVLVALYVNREEVFPEEVAESLGAEVLTAKVENLVERLRSKTDADVQAPSELNHEAGAIAHSEDEAEAPLQSTEEPVVTGTTAEGKHEEEPLTQSEDEVEQALPANVESAIIEATTVAEVSAPAALKVAEESNNEPQTVEVSGATDEPDAAQAHDAQLVAAPTDSVVSPDAAVLQSATTVPPLVSWRAARAAVWQGDLDGAVAHYRTLISAQPDNFDAYGEMGNVLLAQSNVPAAIEAYVSAARLIRTTGNREMAYRLVGVVARLDEEQGRALYDEFYQLQNQ